MKVFYKKALALTEIKQQDNDDIHLFSEDISDDNKKRFITCTRQDLYKKCVNNTNHYYENIEKNQDVKLHLDIDYRINNMPELDRHRIADEYINEITEIINRKLAIEYNIINPEIIVLSAITETKISLHVIYVNIAFDDIYKMKYFIGETKMRLIENNIVDLLIYRTGCFRILWSSKINKNNRLEFYRGINYEYNNNEDLFYDSLLLNMRGEYYILEYNMPHIEKLDSKIKKYCDEMKISYNCITPRNYIPLDILKRYMECINISRADKYREWVNIGLALYHSNIDAFDIWNEWSKKSKSYSSTDECRYKWNSFATERNNIIDFGSLKAYAQYDNPIEFSHIVEQKDKINILSQDEMKEYVRWRCNNVKKSFSANI